MNCKVCLKEIDDDVYCEVCGDRPMCEDCADECEELDENFDRWMEEEVYD